MITATAPDEINFIQLAALKGAVGLEVKGMTRRGRSAYSIAKEKYGLKGNKEKVFAQLCQMVDRRIEEKQNIGNS